MKKHLVSLVVFGLLAPTTTFAVDCSVYHDAIMNCAKQGCETTIDDFANCLVEEEGITDDAEDGTDEISELVECFHTQYECENGDE